MFLKDDIFLEIPLSFVVAKYLGFTPMSSWEFAPYFLNLKYLATSS